MNIHADKDWRAQIEARKLERNEVKAKIQGHNIALRAKGQTEAMKAHHQRMIRNLELQLANLN